MTYKIYKRFKNDNKQIFWSLKTDDKEFLIFPKLKSKYNSIDLNITKKDGLKINPESKKIILKDMINIDYFFSADKNENEIIKHIMKTDFGSHTDVQTNDCILEEINDYKTTEIDIAEINNLKSLKINKEKYKKSINKLEYLINGKELESEFQKWISDNSWLFPSTKITGTQFSINTNSGSLRPDFLFSNPFGKNQNILEIKKPSTKILSYDDSHKTWYWSSEVSKAIGQVRNYLDGFCENPNLNKKSGSKRITINPYGIILCGMQSDMLEDDIIFFNSLNNELRSIKIMTFDVLLQNLKDDFEKIFLTKE